MNPYRQVRALGLETVNIMTTKRQSRTDKRTQERLREEAERGGDPVEDVRVVGLIKADLARMADMMNGLEASGERYLGDLRIALGASVRVDRRLRHLVDKAEGC